MATTGTVDVRLALQRTAGFFSGRQTRCGVLARRLLQRIPPDDDSLADHVVRARRRTTRLDGSVEGSLVRTAWIAWELLDLGCPADHAAVVRTLGYVLKQPNAPGHFGEGCSTRRHELKLCRHFLSGFFSPGARDDAIAPLQFPSGVTIEQEQDARFAASCFALRVVLRAGEDRRAAVRQHLDSLLEIPGLWDSSGEPWLPDLTFFALGALALAPIDYRQRLEPRTSFVLDHQNADGGWPDTHLFHALDMALSMPTQAAQEAVRRAAPLLCSLQREGGAFDADENEEPALIALRSLTLAAG